MPTMVPKELAVMMALTNLLGRIWPGEINYATNAPFDIDLRQKVFRGRITIGSEVQMPAVALLESPQPFDAQHAGDGDLWKNEGWRVLVQGFSTDDKQNPSDPAYRLKAALQVQLSRVGRMRPDGSGKPLFPDDYMLGNLISGLKIGQGVVRPPQENVSQYAFCYIPLIINLQTDASNPYVALPE